MLGAEVGHLLDGPARRKVPLPVAAEVLPDGGCSDTAGVVS